ncbi:MAG: FAD binding domain-containing protein [Alphaproteobacteria bacterium]|nr:FAD binding domain-containing protein [Alphaproteobacteria bacterium]
MIAFPTSPEQAAVALEKTPGAARAGATDLQERRHKGLHTGGVVDLRDLDGFDQIEVLPDGAVRLGAGLRLKELAADPMLGAAWPGLVMAAGGLATPQIRARATLGGSLLQEVRCWYYRNPAFTCLKRGGSACLARQGDHLFHSVVDLGPCAAPHPSTMGMVLLALDASVELADGEERPLSAVLGGGTNPKRTHELEPEALIVAVKLPPAAAGARSAYGRSIHRSRSEWPLVEAFVQLETSGGKVSAARVGLGGVANRPLRLTEVEQALVGRATDDLEPAFKLAEARAKPLPMTGYKVPLMSATLADIAAKALAGPAATPPTPPAPVEEETP